MDDSKDNIKHIDNKDDFDRIATEFFGKFSEIHNVLKNDYFLLLKITENITDAAQHDVLLRACIKEFFSLIEADLFYLNIIDPYQGYGDKDDFFKKFKKTFKQFSKTFNKTEIQESYFDKSFQSINNLKEIRDNLTHPKEVEHIKIPQVFKIEALRKAFDEYSGFINNLMTDVFISINLSDFLSNEEE